MKDELFGHACLDYFVRKLIKHLTMTFLITSTVLLWGVALQFTNLEITIAAFAVVIIYWTNQNE